jgi:hypothetical protein
MQVIIIIAAYHITTQRLQETPSEKLPAFLSAASRTKKNICKTQMTKSKLFQVKSKYMKIQNPPVVKRGAYYGASNMENDD